MLARARRSRSRSRCRAWAWAWAWVWVWVWVRVPYLDWFFLNRVSGYGPNRSAPLHYPIRSSPPTGVRANGSEPFANRCRKTDRAVGRLNGCDGSVRTVATVDFWQTRIPFRSAINSAPDFHSQHTKNSKYLSLLN